MELLITKNQDKGMLGGIKFILEAKAILTSEEQELVKKYKAHKYVLFNSEEKNYMGGVFSQGPISYTIDDLIIGMKDKVKDVSILIQKEEIYVEACKSLKIALDVMKSFGGDYRYIFKEDGIYNSEDKKIDEY